MFDRRRIRNTGRPAQGLVISVQDRSPYASSGPHDYEHVLQVDADGREPFDAVVRHPFDLMERRPQPHEVVEVRYDPRTLETVFVLDGDPRYDLDALQARTEALRSRVTLAPGREIDPLTRLESLARLHAAGHLTDDEFAAQKARVLAQA